MKTLILYSSRDGQTKKIAEFMAQYLEGEVVVSLLTEELDLPFFDRVIIGASIRYGHFNKQLYHFVERHHELLNAKSAVFFGVNLTARKEGKDTPEGNAYVRKFLQRIKWTPAKVGVFAIALGAYLPQFPTLVPEFEAQYDAFKKTIPDTVEMIDGGIVTTKELSMEAGDKFRAADVDLVILQLLTYATSYNMLPAVRDLNVPVVLVNVQKRKAPDYANTDTPKWLGELYACGAVGEMVADLERAGKRHAVITGVVEGGDAYVAKEIDEWCRAAQVRRRFRYTNIAQIGRPYPGMMDLYLSLIHI